MRTETKEANKIELYKILSQRMQKNRHGLRRRVFGHNVRHYRDLPLVFSFHHVGRYAYFTQHTVCYIPNNKTKISFIT